VFFFQVNLRRTSHFDVNITFALELFCVVVITRNIDVERCVVAFI
jgi:hypothetical protein